MFVGLGNKADVDFCEMIKYADKEPNTKCIAVYIEALDSPEAFKKACLECEKPITAIKVGSSEIGVKAAFAHTASENQGHQMLNTISYSRNQVFSARRHGRSS